MLKCQQLLAYNIYEHDKFHAQLILAKKIFKISGPGTSQFGGLKVCKT